MAAPDWQVFEDFAGQVMAEERIPGMAVAVAGRGRLLYSKGFGVRDLQTGAPVTPDTVFGIASVSKSFTALGIIQLASAGKLGLDEPVVEYLPSFGLRGAAETSEVRVRHLLSHTTGVPPLKRRSDLATYDAHLSYLSGAEYQLLGRPGEYLSYCNDTFLVLGALIERISGMPYRDYMMDRVLGPMGLARTTYDIRDLIPLDNVTQRYSASGESRELCAHRWFELGRYEVGGGVSSTALDLLKYGEVYVNGGRAGETALVSAELLKEMWKPVYPLGPGSHYCLALQVLPDHGGFTVAGHGGSQIGVSSRFGFVPGEGVVAVVLTNVSGAPAGTVWLAAVNTALGLPLDLGQREQPCYRPSGEELELLTGAYACDEGGKLRISLDDGRLLAEAENGRFPAVMASPDAIVFDAHHQQMRVQFHRDPTGRPWAIFAGLRMMRRAEAGVA